MRPTFIKPDLTPPLGDFPAECKQAFLRHTAARKIAPFHVDKHRYDELAWREVDAYLDWLEVQSL